MAFLFIHTILTELSIIFENTELLISLAVKDETGEIQAMPIPNEHLNQFKPGESGNPNGRPKKIYTLLKQSGYSKDDIRDAFEEIGWQSLEDIQEVLDDPTKPAILKVIARAFLRGAEKGDFRYVSEIITHAIGKPKEQVDVTSGGDPLKFDISLKL